MMNALDVVPTTDPDDLAIKPWEKQETEGNSAFHAFVHFRNLLPHKRTMAGAYTDHLRHCKSQDCPKLVHCSPSWQRWRFVYGWQARVLAHDRELAARDRLARIHQIDQMNQRHIHASMAVQQLVLDRLQQILVDGEILQMSSVALARTLDLASTVERRARGVPTEIIKHEGEGGGLLDLSSLSDAELAIFEALVAKAEHARTLKSGGSDAEHDQ